MSEKYLYMRSFGWPPYLKALAPVVQKLDSELRYPLDSDLSGG